MNRVLIGQFVWVEGLDGEFFYCGSLLSRYSARVLFALEGRLLPAFRILPKGILRRRGQLIGRGELILSSYCKMRSFSNGTQVVATNYGVTDRCSTLLGIHFYT